MKTKRLLALISSVMMFIALFAVAPSFAEGKKTVTVTTSFLYDMVKSLAGENVEIELVIPAGEDPHVYVAKPSDLKKIQKADLLLYHGLHFEGKIAELLDKTGFAVSEKFPKEKLTTMTEEGVVIVDPHFWFDIELYKMASQTAGEKLAELLSDKKDEIEKNTAAYLEKLDALHKENMEKLAGIPKERRILVTPHDAFNYFSKAYDVQVVAPQGVSTDSEVSSADIDETVKFIVENGVKAIFTESTTNPERMEKLKELCKAKGFEVKVVSGHGQELFSDSLAPAGEFGDNFIDMYRHNVDLIVNNLK